MATYEASTRTTITTASAGAVLAAFRSSTTQRAEIKEIHIFNVTAPTTSGGIGLVRSTALGTGALTSVTGIARDPNAVATTGAVVSAWATAAPTTGGVGTTLRRFHHGTGIGNGIVWTFDLTRMLIVPLGNVATGELAIINLQATAAATYDLTVVWEE